jgi:lipopolysaccharide export LptBFGC system permease protein LptF
MVIDIIAIIISFFSIGISIWIFTISTKHNRNTNEIQISIKEEINKFSSLYLKHTEDLTNILKIHTKEDKNIIIKSLNGRKRK